MSCLLTRQVSWLQTWQCLFCSAVWTGEWNPPRNGFLNDLGLPRKDLALHLKDLALPQKDLGLPQENLALPQKDLCLPQKDVGLPQ